MDKEILNGAVYDHVRTNTSYTVISQGLVKVAEGEWIPCVTYCPYGQPNTTFVRDTEHFKQKFVLSNRY